MRGEEGGVKAALSGVRELPPHARRRVPSTMAHAATHGITSACAEKSSTRPNGSRTTRNYLRMRGEEMDRFSPQQPQGELPPHARRRAARRVPLLRGDGITSACAEKRSPRAFPVACPGNYPRMRGEEPILVFIGKCDAELPPHARRRGWPYRWYSARHGITSACAEKRPVSPSTAPAARNYLRMRGEEH